MRAKIRIFCACIQLCISVSSMTFYDYYNPSSWLSQCLSQNFGLFHWKLTQKISHQADIKHKTITLPRHNTLPMDYHCQKKLTLQSLNGMDLDWFLLMQSSMHFWNFLAIRAPSSQLHSEYGKPCHLHRQSGQPAADFWFECPAHKKFRELFSYTNLVAPNILRTNCSI